MGKCSETLNSYNSQKSSRLYIKTPRIRACKKWNGTKESVTLDSWTRIKILCSLLSPYVTYILLCFIFFVENSFQKDLRHLPSYSIFYNLGCSFNQIKISKNSFFCNFSFSFMMNNKISYCFILISFQTGF